MTADRLGKRKKFDELRAQLDRLAAQPARKKRAEDFSVEEVRRAIRKHKPRSPRPAEQPPIVYSRDLPRREAPAPRSCAEDGPRVKLEEAVSGEEITRGERGRVYVVSTHTRDLTGGRALCRRFGKRMLPAAAGLRQRVAAACDLQELSADDLIFVDVESTGLGNSPLFLVGIMVWEGEGFAIRQFLARNYAEEAAVVSLFVEECEGKRLLVTFNGKSFDLPYLRVRAAANGIALPPEPPHFDLLHECRRVWRGVLPDCRLQTLESRICGRLRGGDIPGSEIPEAYHAFVRTGDARQIAEIVRHNMFDLVTMADLMVRLPAPGEGT